MKEGIIYILTDRGNKAIKRRGPLGVIENIEDTENYWYLKTAIASAKSLRKHMPEKHVTLFTDHEFNDEVLEQLPFDDVVDFGPVERDFWCKRWEVYGMSPYEYTYHLDSDTFVCDTFQEVFDLLQNYNFDLAATLSLTYQSRRMSRYPLCFPELACGAMAWKKSEKMDDFIEMTYNCLMERKSRKRGADEPCMRLSLLNSDIRYAVLPWEYNCWHNFPQYLFGKVKILHGKVESLEENSKIINYRSKEEEEWPWIRLLTGNKVLYYEVFGGKAMHIAEEKEYGAGLKRRIV